METEKLRAIAGPIPPGQIEDFYVKWKRGGTSTPRRSSSSSTDSTSISSANLTRKRAWQFAAAADRGGGLDTLRGDYKKGMERVGRTLCREYGVPWAERWDFLDDFLDINATDGLRKLDEHLKTVRDECIDSVDVLYDSFIHVVDSDREDLECEKTSSAPSTPKVRFKSQMCWIPQWTKGIMDYRCEDSGELRFAKLLREMRLKTVTEMGEKGRSTTYP